LIFSIIKTNKNKTAIAPTYTTKKVIGKKSNFRKNKRDETLQKESTKNKAEKTGLLAKTTNVEDKMAKLEKM
jgi:hypothetical protein